MIKFLLCILSFTTAPAFADNLKVYIDGSRNPTNSILVDKVLTATPVPIQTDPTSLTLLNAIKKDPQAIAVTNTTILFSRLRHHNPLNDVKIIGAFGSDKVIAFHHKGHKMPSDKIVFGGIGNGGYCEYGIRQYAKDKNISYKYISYTLSPVMQMDVLADRLDASCGRNTTLATLESNTFEVLPEISKYVEIKEETIVVVNKNIDKNTEKDLVTRLSKALNNSNVHNELQAMGFVPNIKPNVGDDFTTLYNNYWDDQLKKHGVN